MRRTYTVGKERGVLEGGLEDHGRRADGGRNGAHGGERAARVLLVHLGHVEPREHVAETLERAARVAALELGTGEVDEREQGDLVIGSGGLVEDVGGALEQRLRLGQSTRTPVQLRKVEQ